MIGTSDMSERRWLDLNAQKENKMDLLRAENRRLKQENEALRSELSRTQDELKSLQEALTILPMEE